MCVSLAGADTSIIFCRYKTCLLSQQKYACHDRTFVGTKRLSQQTRVCRDKKMILVAAPANDICVCALLLLFVLGLIFVLPANLHSPPIASLHFLSSSPSSSFPPILSSPRPGWPFTRFSLLHSLSLEFFLCSFFCLLFIVLFLRSPFLPSLHPSFLPVLVILARTWHPRLGFWPAT